MTTMPEIRPVPPPEDIARAREYIEGMVGAVPLPLVEFVSLYGFSEPGCELFAVGTTPEAAVEDYLDNRLATFGDYAQDCAMTGEEGPSFAQYVVDLASDASPVELRFPRTRRGFRAACEAVGSGLGPAAKEWQRTFEAALAKTFGVVPGPNPSAPWMTAEEVEKHERVCAEIDARRAERTPPPPPAPPALVDPEREALLDAAACVARAALYWPREDGRGVDDAEALAWLLEHGSPDVIREAAAAVGWRPRLRLVEERLGG